MFLQEIVQTYCPSCGEAIELAIDCSVPQQEYIEDCQVCCRPICISAQVDDEGFPAVMVRDENAG